MTAADFATVLVVDFGAQYAQLIARRVREAHVHSVIVPSSITAAEVAERAPAGIILSGGPASVYAEGAPSMDPAILELGIPTLGICYGQQLMAQALGGTVANSDVAEYGKTELAVDHPGVVLSGTPRTQTVWMSHRDAVSVAPPGFVVTAATDAAPCAVIEDSERRLFGVQYHPEVSHTPHGQDVLKAFLYEGAGIVPTWTPLNVIEDLVARIREQVGDRPVLCGLSGGVDSSVAAALVHKAVGDQLTCVFVDHGLMRHDEGLQVEATFRDHFHVDLVHVKAQDRFLGALAGVDDPETKRKIIGEHFIRVFEESAREVYADAGDGLKFLVQGTLYPDVIESGGSESASTIKSHHNVGGLPDDMEMELHEPLYDLYKDEVRAVARHQGIEVAERQPFPGPGLAVRVIGELTPERVMIAREACHIMETEVHKAVEAGQMEAPWQYFAVLTNTPTVGVQGDLRAYGETVAVRAVQSFDAMTAQASEIPWPVLQKVSRGITNHPDLKDKVNRVVYDITDKPPATVEWE